MKYQDLTKLCKFLVPALAISAISNSYAANDDEFAPFYIGGGIGYSMYSNVEEFYVYPGDDNYKLEDDAFGYGFVFGWEFLEGLLSAEFVYHNFGRMEFSDAYEDGSVSYINTYKGEVETKGLAIKGAFPISSTFSVYGKLGYAEWEWSEKYKESVFVDGEFDAGLSDSGNYSYDDSDFFYGLGVDYYYQPNIVFYGEYLYQQAELSFGNETYDWFNAATFTAGVRWKFGSESFSWRRGSNKRSSGASRGLTACQEEYKEDIGGVICQNQ